jgi:hypothetical protein
LYIFLIFLMRATCLAYLILFDLFTLIIWCSVQVKEDEMGRTCGTHGGGERCLRGFCWDARK